MNDLFTVKLVMAPKPNPGPWIKYHIIIRDEDTEACLTRPFIETYLNTMRAGQMTAIVQLVQRLGYLQTEWEENSFRFQIVSAMEAVQ